MRQVWPDVPYRQHPVRKTLLSYPRFAMEARRETAVSADVRQG